MKVKIEENEGYFFISFDAENVADAAMLARIGLNVKRSEKPELWIQAEKFGAVQGTVGLAKIKDQHSYIEVAK